jgi:hypothetical protein
MNRIGPTRLRILGILIERRRMGLNPPTLRELSRHFGFSGFPSGIKKHLDALHREGLIFCKGFANRAYEVRCRFIPENELGGPDE